MAELFDTHCHLDFPHFEDDREAAVARMREAGVTRAVLVSVEAEQRDRLAAFVEAHDGFWFSVGVHPNHEVAAETGVDALVALSEHDRCVAIGETGLDFFRHRVSQQAQEARFRTHIRAARERGLPLIVHMREADEATLRILSEERANDCGGVMHCFSSDWEAASRALDLGFSISFSGNVTFPRNEALREVAVRVPDEALLVETDSPYLAPVPRRGKRNEPALVRHVAECLADARGVSLDALAELTTRNALRRFNLEGEAA
ncbi:MAG: TatD family hydrolase [Mariprofundaceae bacterium]